MANSGTITSKAVFLAPLGKKIGISAKILLRNTLRNPFDSLKEMKENGINFKLHFFDAYGNALLTEPHNGNIPFDSFTEIEAEKFLDKEKAAIAELLVAVTEIASTENMWFEQEHEIIYSTTKSMAKPSLIYDQLPFRILENYPPILLLNHKIYLSQKLRPVLALSNYRNNLTDTTPLQFMEVSYFHADGKLLLRKEYDIPYNTVFYVDVQNELKDLLILNAEPELIAVTARGGNSTFAIVTLIFNPETGNFAIEHSLAPPYFVSENMSRVRNKGLIFRR